MPDAERCYVNKCHTSVPATSLMCRYHWRFVPYALQKIIQANEPITRKRLVAVEQAILEVEKIERELRMEAQARDKNCHN